MFGFIFALPWMAKQKRNAVLAKEWENNNGWLGYEDLSQESNNLWIAGIESRRARIQADANMKLYI